MYGHAVGIDRHAVGALLDLANGRAQVQVFAQRFGEQVGDELRSADDAILLVGKTLADIDNTAFI